MASEPRNDGPPSSSAAHGGPTERFAESLAPSVATDQRGTTLAIALTTHNSMRTLPATLAAIQPLGGRLVVIDSGSSDGSIDACRAAGAEVIHRKWAGHVAQKQFAIDRCGDVRWVLLLDSDEAPDAALVDAMRVACAQDRPEVAGYEVNRRLVLHGRQLRYAFQPEWRLRLFRPSTARVAGNPPHDFVAVQGRVDRLAGDLLHDSWADAEDMLRRQVGYARISSAQTTGGGRLHDLLFRPSAAFAKQYLLRQGWRDGWRGLVAAAGAAASTLMKHIAIAERRGREIERSKGPSAIGPPAARSDRAGSGRRT